MLKSFLFLIFNIFVFEKCFSLDEFFPEIEKGSSSEGGLVARQEVQIFSPRKHRYFHEKNERVVYSKNEYRDQNLLTYNLNNVEDDNIEDKKLKLNRIDQDRRIAIDRNQVLLYPYKTVVSIAMRVNNNYHYIGSGTIISKGIIITAAHNVFLFRTKEIAKNIRLYFCRFGDSYTDDFPVTGYAYHKIYNDTKSQIHDYAVLYVGENIEIDKYGWIFPKIYKSDQYSNKQATISGYPGEVIEKEVWTKKDGKYQYEHSGKNSLVTPEDYGYRYEIDTTEGQSGSSVRILENGSWSSIGVHNTGSPSFNYGVPISKKVFKNIRKWSNYLNENLNKLKKDTRHFYEDGVFVYLSHLEELSKDMNEKFTDNCQYL